MQKKHLLLILLMALFAPIAMNAQGTVKANRPLQFNPGRSHLVTNVNRDSNRETTYEKVTSSPSDWSGNYVLAYNSSSTAYAFSGVATDSIGDYTTVTSTNSGNTIASPGSAAILTIAPISGTSYYSIQINGGGYLASGTYGLYTSSTIDNYTQWNISYTSSGIQINCPIWSGGPYYFVLFQYSSDYTWYSEMSTSHSYWSYAHYPSLYKETTSGGGQEQGLTVANGTGTNVEVPFYGLYADDNYQHTQTIYPASMLTDMQGGQITKLTYYLSSSVTKDYGSTFEVRFGTTTSANFNTGTVNYLSVSNSAVYSGTLSVNGTTVVFDFSSNPYTYTGGNLVVDVRITALGTGYNSTSFYGQSGSTNYSVKNRSTSSLPTTNGTAVSFMPKTTFTYTVSNTYTLTTSANPSAGGTVTPSGTNTYNGGISVQVNATANTGYTFSGWTLDGASAGNTNPYTLTMNDDHTLVANFTALPQYTITVNAATGGTVSGGGTYYQGEQATLTATANSGYAFAGWQLNGSTVSTDNPYTITVNANATYTAVFETLAQHNITVTQATGGTISASANSAYMGDVITLTATPETGYFFVEWNVVDANNQTVAVNNNQFTMPNSDVTVTASFTQGFQITLVQTANGTISASQTTNLHPNDHVTLTATPNSGCVFLAWYAYKTGNPRDVVAVIANTTIIMPASDVTVQAIFVTEEEHEAQLGSGTSTDQYIPTRVRRSYSLTQQIYLASELNNQNGRITKIAFRATTASATRNLTIYMAHTEKSSFSSTTDWEIMGTVAKVFEGSVTFGTSDWTTITLNTPFEYDGTSNINLCVVDNTGSASGTNNSYTQFYRYDANNRALYVNSNNTSYANTVGYSSLNSTYGTRYSYVNRINITMMVPGSAESLTVSPGEINDFSYVEGQGPSEVHKLGVVGVALSNNVTVTAPTDFEVCLTDDGTYTSSVTIPRETSKRSRNVTTWDFEGTLDGWTALDADNDGYNWVLGSATAGVYLEGNLSGGHSGSDMLVSGSWTNVAKPALDPDNWLISPQVELGGSFSMWAKGQQPAYPAEHFGIFVSTTGTNPSDFTMLNEYTATATWKQYSVDLGLYTGQTGYIAVRHFGMAGNDQFLLDVDDFELDTEATITVEMPVVITPATVFVRMKDNLSAGNYSGTLTASAGTGDNLNGSVSLSGEVLAACNITLTANPTEAGAVAGAGTYAAGSEVTVSARTNSPYSFINWTENGTVVSTEASYTFTVTGDRTLVANFGFIKEIDAWTSDGTGNNPPADGWYFIASPVTEEITPSANNGFLTSAYDLYYFNQDGDSEGLEWINHKHANDGGFNIVNGTGYLYASSTDTRLIFSGTAYSGDGEVTLTVGNNATDSNMNGWNLVGNPFADTAYISMPFYTLDGGSEYDEKAAGDKIEPMQGILVHTDAAATLTFSTTKPNNTGKRLTLNLTQGRSVMDRAIVCFNESKPLPKIQFREGNSKVYFPMDGKDYAVVSAQEQGEMPVNFKAKENSHYTLTVNAEDLEMNYLHLIDNLTGNDVDLLANPFYSFDAKTTDYASRFKLVFVCGDANGDDDTFAFFSNGGFVINNEGNATLQVIDVNGRILKSESINGCANVNVNAAAGVYMLRLINGDNVKTQKVVVK